MPDLALDLRYLRYAFLVAEHGSFRAAADNLCLTQSTVSRRIQILERRLGFPLFERSPKGARLTAVGQRFIQSAAVGAAHMHQAILETREAGKSAIGELRVGVAGSLANGFLGELLESYRTAYPQIDIRVDEISARTAGGRLLNRTLDFAFLTGQPDLAGCITSKMWSERLVIALPKNHPLAGRPRLGWQDLDGETFLCPASERCSELESLLNAKICLAGIKARIAVHNVGRDNLLGLAARGFGLFVSMESDIAGFLAMLAVVPVGDATEAVSFSGAWLADAPRPEVLQFVEFTRRMSGRGDAANCRSSSA